MRLVRFFGGVALFLLMFVAVIYGFSAGLFDSGGAPVIMVIYTIILGDYVRMAWGLLRDRGHAG
jgi:TRAP-type C4-dicarboxylate transport system permease large subunit